MIEVRIIGWRSGLRKVSMTRLLQKQCGLRLKEAKDYTDDVLAGNPVVLQILDASQAQRLADELDSIGAIVELKTSL